MHASPTRTFWQWSAIAIALSALSVCFAGVAVLEWLGPCALVGFLSSVVRPHAFQHRPELRIYVVSGIAIAGAFLFFRSGVLTVPLIAAAAYMVGNMSLLVGVMFDSRRRRRASRRTSSSP